MTITQLKKLNNFTCLIETPGIFVFTTKALFIRISQIYNLLTFHSFVFEIFLFITMNTPNERCLEI